MAGDSGNILERLLSVFFSSHDPEAEKRRQLKAIAKELSKSRYKCYRPGPEEALPGIGKFFYEIYKVIGAAQVILTNANSSVVLKNILVELSLSNNQVKLKERLTEDAIKERGKTTPPKELSAQVKNELAAFMAEFDLETIKGIDTLYSQLEVMVNFVSFVYYFLL